MWLTWGMALSGLFRDASAILSPCTASYARWVVGDRELEQAAPAGRRSGPSSLLVQSGSVVHLVAVTKAILRSGPRRLDKNILILP